MDSFLLQDWISLGGAPAAQTIITQSESCWLDLASYDDVVFYTDVRSIGGSPLLAFQTAPAAEDAAFQPMAPAVALVASTGPVVTSVLATFASVPLARYVRWQLTLTGAGNSFTTMRIWAATFAPGA